MLYLLSPCYSVQLNDYIIGIIRARRAARAANGGKPPAKPDILDRVLTAAEVRAERCMRQLLNAACLKFRPAAAVGCCWRPVECGMMTAASRLRRCCCWITTSWQLDSTQPPTQPNLLLAAKPPLPQYMPLPQESGEKWTAASEVQLCYEVKTFLLAGHETSSAMLCWSMYELSKNAGALENVSVWVIFRLMYELSKTGRHGTRRGAGRWGSAVVYMYEMASGALWVHAQVHGLSLPLHPFILESPAPLAHTPPCPQLSLCLPPASYLQVRAEAAAVYGTAAPRDAMPDREGVDSMEFTHSVLKVRGGGPVQ